MMERTVFDQIARDYERIHNRSLPPGVHSDEFVSQKAESVVQWITRGYRGKEFCYLDFGCGNGRLFKSLAESPALKPLIEKDRLRLFGFDTSLESLEEAKTVAGPHKVCLVNDLKDLPRDIRFDLVISCNVFHHIVPAERAAAAKTLRGWMKPIAQLVIWEHNPFNPLTRMLVKICPFDKDARLLKLSATKTLFETHSCRHVRHAYVNVVPPRWQKLKLLSALERKLTSYPIGAQYWVMFENHE